MLNWTRMDRAPPTYDDNHFTLVAQRDRSTGRYRVAVASPDGDAWIGGDYEPERVIFFDFWLKVPKPAYFGDRR